MKRATKPKYHRTGGYSKEFAPGDTWDRYLLDRIPRPLWRKVRAKCKADEISVRARILSLLTAWVER